MNNISIAGHTLESGKTIKDHLHVGEAPAAEEARKMIDCVNTRYYVKSTSTTEGAYNTASMAGIPSVLIGRGQLSLCPDEEVLADKGDVYNILKFLGVLEGEYKTYQKNRPRDTKLL